MTTDQLPDQALTLFRGVTIHREEHLDDQEAGGHVRQLLAYLRLDGPAATWRKALSRLDRVGHHAARKRVAFSAQERLTRDGNVQQGRWAGQAIGQVIRSGQDVELLTWRYFLTRAKAGPIGAAPARPASEGGGHSQPSVGLIGAGAFARNVIIPSLKRTGVVPTVIADASSIRAKKLASDSGIPRVADCPASLLHTVDDLNGLIIACAHSAHPIYALEAARAGVSIYLEKPAAVDPDQLDLLADEVTRTRAPLTVGHNRRNSAFFSQLSATTSRPAHVHMSIEAFPLHSDHWYLAPGEGGRFLGNLTHWIDLALALMDDESPSAIRSFALPNNGTGLDLLFPDESLAEIRFHELGPRLMPGRESITVRSYDNTFHLFDWHTSMSEGSRHSRRVKRLRDRGHASSYARWVERLRSPPPNYDAMEVRRMLSSHHLAFKVQELSAARETDWQSMPQVQDGAQTGGRG